MAKKIKRAKIFTMQPDIDCLLDIKPEDFEPATDEQKDSHMGDRASTSYWRDAMRRLFQNKVSMVALGIIVILVLFAFLGPVIVPYSYEQQMRGTENLYPWHYSLEDQRRLDEAVGDPAQRLEAAIANAEAEKGGPLDNKDLAIIKAKIKSSSLDKDTAIEQLGIKKQLFGYSRAELERKEAGEDVFPHIFGTDKHGRDIMVRTMIGTRVSMLIGIFSALLVLVIGAIYGSISGFMGGKVDAVMMRFVELIYSIPEMLVVLLLSTALKFPLQEYVNSSTGPIRDIVHTLGPNMISLFIAFALLYWVTMARIIRGQVLQLKEQEFVTAAKALGGKSGLIIRKHLLPNCIGQIVVTTCLQIPSAIFLESFLSFLGVGITEPMTSLGSMASDALAGVQTYGYRLVIPAIILSILILSFNLFGDGLRDALDPKLRK